MLWKWEDISQLPEISLRNLDERYCIAFAFTLTQCIQQGYMILTTQKYLFDYFYIYFVTKYLWILITIIITCICVVKETLIKTTCGAGIGATFLQKKIYCGYTFGLNTVVIEKSYILWLYSTVICCGYRAELYTVVIQHSYILWLYSFEVWPFYKVIHIILWCIILSFVLNLLTYLWNIKLPSQHCVSTQDTPVVLRRIYTHKFSLHSAGNHFLRRQYLALLLYWIA